MINPPNWGNALGERDLMSSQDVELVLTQACNKFCDSINSNIPDVATARKLHDNAILQWTQHNAPRDENDPYYRALRLY